MYATQASANRSLSNNTPGSLDFHRDMMLDIPLIADLITICNSLQATVDDSLRIANLRRLNHDYRQCEQVMSKSKNPTHARWTGPYEIVAVHVNGNLIIRLNAHTVEGVITRRLDSSRILDPDASFSVVGECSILRLTMIVTQ
jgi:hypothetical protein